MFGMLAGGLLSMLMPDSWWNSESSPWVVDWITFPAWVLYVGIGILLEIDVMTDAADIAKVERIWTVSFSLILGMYSVAAFGIFRWLRKRKFSV